MNRIYLFLLLSCSETEALKVYNTDPTVNITSHSEGTTLVEGNPYTFFAIASDANDDDAALSVSWLLGTREICPDRQVDVSGESSCEGIPQEGEGELRAIVRDPNGASGDDAISFVLESNTAPIVQIQEGSAVVFQDQLQLFYAHVSDDRTAVGDLSVWWESASEGVLDSQDFIDAQGMVETVLSLGVGEHLVRLYAEDEQGKIGSDSMVVTVLESNTAPTCSILFPQANAQFTAAEVFTFQGLVSDAESEANDLWISISAGPSGIVYEGFPDSTGFVEQVIGLLGSGEHILTLRAEDPHGAFCTSSVSVQVGLAPTIQWITPFGGGTENEGIILLQTFSSDMEDGLENLAVQVESSLDGVLASGLTDSSGLYTIQISTLSIGTHVLEATVTDSGGLSATAVSSLTINGLPSAPTVSISPSAPTTVSDLQAIAGGSIDPEGASVAYTYEWFSGSSSQSASASDVLPHSQTQKGELWTVRVTPSDGLGEGVYTEQSVVIQNSAPAIVSASLSPAVPQIGDTLSATVSSSDADGDTVSLSYDWMVNGASVSASSTLTSGFVRGDDIELSLLPSDGQDSGSAYVIGPVTVQNTPPTAPVIDLSPSAPIEGIDDLLCSVDVNSSDADGDAVQYSYYWTVNGTAYSGAITTYETGDTVPGSDTIAQEDWTCTVTPSDGIDIGTSTSSSVTISAPTGCPSGFSLAFDITDDVSDQMAGGCSWLWTNLFSLGTQISLEWWGSNGLHYGPSTWDLSGEISSIEANYLGCSSTTGSNYNLPSSDGLYYMTLVQYNDLLHIHPYGEQAQFGTSFYYGRISPGYSQDDEIYAVGYSDWGLAWQNRYESGDRFRACYAP